MALGSLRDAPSRGLQAQPGLRQRRPEEPLHLLFLCSMNQWRSPTAETIYRRHPQVQARSAGLSQRAKRRVNDRDIQWADLILVMEDRHAQRLRAAFRDELRHKDLHVLDIPDEYRYMDPALIQQITRAVEPLLGRRR